MSWTNNASDKERAKAESNRYWIENSPNTWFSSNSFEEDIRQSALKKNNSSNDVNFYGIFILLVMFVSVMVFIAKYSYICLLVIVAISLLLGFKITRNSEDKRKIYYDPFKALISVFMKISLALDVVALIAALIAIIDYSGVIEPSCPVI